MNSMFCKTNSSSTACAFADASSSCANLSLISDAIVMASVSVISLIVRVVRVIISNLRINILRLGIPERSGV